MEQYIGYVYKITSPTGKTYIGQRKASSFDEDYWSSSQNQEYWNDIKLYGKDKFIREVLCWCKTLDELNEKEVFYIKECHALASEGGYNICLQFPQVEWTEQVIKRHHESTMKYWTDEHRKAHGQKIKQSEKYKQSRLTVGPKISKAIKESSKFKTKYNFAKTEEFKQKQRELNSKKKWYNNGQVQIYIPGDPPEGFTRGMLPSKIKGIKKSEEHKLKLKQSKLGRVWWNNRKVELFSKESPGSDFIKGRLKKPPTNK